ncbi:MAG TPA: right-handed parallel beta-helix repeat-containing protein [Xanthobacteraceae bacterium]|jgi:hypothetical protein
MRRSPLVILAAALFAIPGHQLASGANAAAVGGKTYYIAANGNDNNDGLSEAHPWQSLAKVTSSTFQAGDRILFRGGDTFGDGTLLLRGPNGGGRQNVYSTADSPVTVGSYGSPCKPLTGVLSGCATIAPPAGTANGIVVNNLNGVIVQDLIVTGAGTSKQGEGVYLRNSDPSSATYGEVTVQNVSVTGWDVGILVQGTAGTAGWTNFAIRGTHVYGSKGNEESGIQLQGPAPGQPGKMTNTKCVIENNLVENIAGLPNRPNGLSGNGILIKETSRCISQFNVVHDSGRNTNTCGGPAGDWAYDADNITFRFDETYGMGPAVWTKGCDWDGFDLDGYVTNSVIEYSYAHDNWGAGFEMYISREPTWHHNIIRYNVAENNAKTSAASSFGGVTVANSNPDLAGSAIYNNTIASDGPVNTNVATFDGDSKLLFVNNVLLATGDATVIRTERAGLKSGTLAGNDYFKFGHAGSFIKWSGATYATLQDFRSSTGKESGTGSATDPLFWSPDEAKSCSNASSKQPCPGSYRLQPRSAMIGAGLNLASLYNLNAGDRDYYGHKIPHGVGSGFNIGADGGAER